MAGWLAIFCDPAVNGKYISSHYQVRVKLEFLMKERGKEKIPKKFISKLNHNQQLRAIFVELIAQKTLLKWHQNVKGKIH